MNSIILQWKAKVRAKYHTCFIGKSTVLFGFLWQNLILALIHKIWTLVGQNTRKSIKIKAHISYLK